MGACWQLQPKAELELPEIGEAIAHLDFMSMAGEGLLFLIRPGRFFLVGLLGFLFVLVRKTGLERAIGLELEFAVLDGRLIDDELRECRVCESERCCRAGARKREAEKKLPMEHWH